MNPAVKRVLSATVFIALVAVIIVTTARSARSEMVGCNSPEDSAEISSANARDLYLLLDMSDNSQRLASIAAASFEASLKTWLEGFDADKDTWANIKLLRLGSSSASVEQISLSEGDGVITCQIDGGSKSNMQKWHRELSASLAARVDSAFTSSAPTGTADMRPLLRSVADGITASPDVKRQVIMWSQFAAQGRDCLRIPRNTTANDLTARMIIKRCEHGGYLPDLKNTPLVIVGPGIGAGNDLYASFQRSLAGAFCESVTSSCQLKN